MAVVNLMKPVALHTDGNTGGHLAGNVAEFQREERKGADSSAQSTARFEEPFRRVPLGQSA